MTQPDHEIPERYLVKIKGRIHDTMIPSTDITKREIHNQIRLLELTHAEILIIMEKPL